MISGQHDSLQTEFLTAVYQVDGPETAARAQAERICLDQTIEADAALLAPPLRANILGRLERLRSLDEGRYEATIRYPGNLVGNDHSNLLNLLFGMSSLRSGVRLLSFALTKGLLSSWRGPRHGLAGLRRTIGVFDRPLVCAVLKPLGHSPNELAKLATEFVRGGADLVKDDQALLDQPVCPFNERVARCADAIANASAERGRSCLYFVHISGPLESMRRRAAQAKRFGATGLLVAPGLTGFDALRALVVDDQLALPVASHPSFLGASVSRSGGLAPAVAYALLPRLAGADLTIYPRFDAGYLMSKEECRTVAANSRQPWEHIQPTMPAIGGRMGVEWMEEMRTALGPDTVFVLGSRIQQHQRGVVRAVEEFQRRLRDAS